MREAAIEVVAHFKRAWVERMKPADGKPPRVDVADWKNLATVVRDHGKEAAIGFVDRFLADPEPFLAEEAYALRHLPRKVDRYRVAPPPPRLPANGFSPAVPRKLPSVAELRAKQEAEDAERQLRQRSDLEAEGYRWEADGRWYDPQGRELDDRGRPKKAEASS